MLWNFSLTYVSNYPNRCLKGKFPFIESAQAQFLREMKLVFLHFSQLFVCEAEDSSSFFLIQPSLFFLGGGHVSYLLTKFVHTKIGVNDPQS